MSNVANCAIDSTANPWLNEAPPSSAQVDGSAADCAVAQLFSTAVDQASAPEDDPGFELQFSRRDPWEDSPTPGVAEIHASGADVAVGHLIGATPSDGLAALDAQDETGDDAQDYVTFAEIRPSLAAVWADVAPHLPSVTDKMLSPTGQPIPRDTQKAQPRNEHASRSA